MGPTVLRFCCVAFFAWTWLAVKPASAAESEKLDTAPVVVVGKVRVVFVDDSTAGKGYFVQLIEILVEKVEKAGPGEEPKPEKVLYARTPRFRDVPGVIPPAGVLPVVEPAKGDAVRVYCRRDKDGTYSVLMNAEAVTIVEAAKKTP
jgi:hypothetical protein